MKSFGAMGVILAAVLCSGVMARAQGTSEFGFHGELASDGEPATGSYDLTFTLYDAPTGGNQIGSVRTNFVTAVIAGQFTVRLDFGGAVFWGPPRWLEIGVRTNGGQDFVQLAPRQTVTPIPYSLTASNLSGVLPASQLRGTLPTSILPASVLTNNASEVELSGSFSGSGVGLTNLASQAIALTNLTLDNSLRIACANIDAYGLQRFGWPRTLSKLSTNGLLMLSIVGNGWAIDSEFSGFITNLLGYKPLAGYASEVRFDKPVPIDYGPTSGVDTALYRVGDDTNWHGAYFVLTNTGNISAPAQALVSDVCGVHYLANPGGGTLVLEVRTNGATPNVFTNLDATWTTVANANAFNAAWEGRTLWWSNTVPALTQIRVRSMSPGWTPIVGYAQWNSAITNGVILSQYAHQFSGNWWTYTDTNKVFPIWNTWQPDLVLNTGGYDNTRSTDMTGTLSLLRSGFPQADIVQVGAHLALVGYNCSEERQYCFANRIPFFDGQAASAATWDTFGNGVRMGLYLDSAHLTSKGYATFSQLLWSWLALTARSPAYQLQIGN